MTHLIKLFVITVAALSAVGAASASESEWKVLSVAASYHTSLQGAQYTGDPSYSCTASHLDFDVLSNGQLAATAKSVTPYSAFVVRSPVVSPVANLATDRPIPTPQVASSLGGEVVGGNGQYTLLGHGASSYQVWGRSTYDASTQTAKMNSTYCYSSGHGNQQHWHQANPALGLSYSVRDGGHVDEVFGTLVRDSYGRPSLMVAAGRLWTAGTFAGVTLDAGVVGGLWYRSNLDIASNQLYRSVVPYVLPAAELTHEATGLGLRVAFAPRVQVAGRLYNPTNVFMVQTSYRFKQGSKTVSAGLQSVSVDALDGHGLKLNLTAAF